MKREEDGPREKARKSIDECLNARWSGEEKKSHIRGISGNSKGLRGTQRRRDKGGGGAPSSRKRGKSLGGIGFGRENSAG